MSRGMVWESLRTVGLIAPGEGVERYVQARYWIGRAALHHQTADAPGPFVFLQRFLATGASHRFMARLWLTCANAWLGSGLAGLGDAALDRSEQDMFRADEVLLQMELLSSCFNHAFLTGEDTSRLVELSATNHPRVQPVAAALKGTGDAAPLATIVSESIDELQGDDPADMANSLYGHWKRPDTQYAELLVPAIADLAGLRRALDLHDGDLPAMIPSHRALAAALVSPIRRYCDGYPAA